MSIESITPAAIVSPSAPRAESRLRRWWRWCWRGLLGLLALGFAIVLLLLHSTSWTLAFGGTARGDRLARMQASPHFADGRFYNAESGMVPRVGDEWETVKDFFRGAPDRQPAAPLPAIPRAEILALLATPPASGLRLTWLGHSTLLIEIDGRRFLTDPMFSERASPSRWIGTRRFQPPALAVTDLPQLDGVLLSHDHYDHLDLASIRALNARGVTFYAPLGVGAHLERWGVPPERIVEHDWWEQSRFGELAVTATPAHHFSGRTPFDHNATLWCSWTIVGPRHRVFFSGDTGLAPVFQTIGVAYGPFDVACIDTGAWNASWGDIHLGPAGAVRTTGMLEARRYFPIHWATFMLAPQPWKEPGETAVTEGAAHGIEVVTPPLGAPFEPETAAATPRWWR